jgi:hypothetical protein
MALGCPASATSLSILFCTEETAAAIGDGLLV